MQADGIPSEKDIIWQDITKGGNMVAYQQAGPKYAPLIRTLTSLYTPENLKTKFYYYFEPKI